MKSLSRFFLLTLCSVCIVASIAVLRADTYQHNGDGTLTDGQWINLTTSPPQPPFNYGNPGAADDAYFAASTITASSGSVHLLSAGSFVANGMVNATYVGLMTLSGSGTLNIQAVVTDANGFGPLLYVSGGNLTAQNGDGVADVTAGGTVVDATCSGTNGCGFYNGAGTSLTITGQGGPDHAAFASGGKLIANAGLTDFGLQIMSGSTAQVSTITNSNFLIVDGVGSRLTVAGDVSMNPQSMNIKNGGTATVGGNLTQLEGAPLFVMDSGSSLTVSQDLLQNTGSDTDIRIYNGGTLRVQRDLVETRGQVQVDASGSAL
ncbi:MAG: hypothetical protein M3Y27_06535, partial [Acidobacteriota bacterium]|nr:hypothetical protein [Acidobacteriota bacterium]